MCFHRTILFHVATSDEIRVPTLSGNGHFKISKSFLKVCWVSGAQRRGRYQFASCAPYAATYNTFD
jgi:hypothetical protein